MNLFIIQMTRELFMSKGDKHGLDLHAFDIYRGREHGLPGYVVYVKFCLNIIINDWQDLVTNKLMTQEVIASPHQLARTCCLTHSLLNMTGNLLFCCFALQSVDELRKLYEHVHDLDAFVGAMLEIPSEQNRKFVSPALGFLYNTARKLAQCLM
jgi:hypothetical protein